VGNLRDSGAAAAIERASFGIQSEPTRIALLGQQAVSGAKIISIVNAFAGERPASAAPWCGRGSREGSAMKKVWCIGLTAASVLIGFGPGASAMSAKEKAAVQQAKVTLRQAIAIAQREVPGSLVVDADAVTLSDKVSYAIEVLKDQLYEVRIDLDTGSVLAVVKKRIHPKDWKDLAAVEQAAINLGDAVSVANSIVSGGTLIAADVRTARGSKSLWRINVEKDGLVAIDIDPATGGVLKVALRTQ
jgi:Peptidase propeptide and YPEB domain